MSDGVRQGFIIGALVIALIIRVALFVQYLHLTWLVSRRGGSRSRFSQFLYRVFLGGESEVARTKAESTGWGLDSSLVAGSVSLAAWTQLFAASGELPAARLSGFSLGLLFISSLVLLAHPLLVAGSVNTISRLRRLFTVVGYIALVLSMASIAYDLLGPDVGGLIVVLSTVLFSLRELSVLYHIVKDLRDPMASAFVKEGATSGGDGQEAPSVDKGSVDWDVADRPIEDEACSANSVGAGDEHVDRAVDTSASNEGASSLKND